MSWRVSRPARLAALASSCLAASATSEAGALEVRHQPPGCLRAGAATEIRARIEPLAQVVRARLRFRTDPAAEAHTIVMEPDGQDFVAVLPRPLATLGQVVYWIEATDPALVETASAETTVAVQGECAQVGKTKRAPSPVTPPLGAPPVPEGFDEGSAVASGAAADEPKQVGVFRMGARTSLIAALAVGAGAVAVAARNNPGGNPPEREPEMEPAGARLISVAPPSGATLRDGPTSLRIDVRLVSATEVGGSLIALMFQAPGGPVCAISNQYEGSFLRAHIGRNVTIEGLFSTSACGTDYDVTAVRVQISNFQGVTFTTGTPEIPDLPLRYRVTR